MASVELRGLRALVTGASKGIGHAIANRLHVEGAAVLAAARTSPSLPGGIQFVAADLMSVEGCGAVAAAVRDRLGTSSCTSWGDLQRRPAALPCLTTKSGTARST